MIKVNVKRYDPVEDLHYTESYEIEKTPKMKVLDALHQINKKYDANIAYRYSCRAGQCGSCAIKVNQEAVLACKEEIQDNDTLEALDFNIIKDLIVDRQPFSEEVRDLNLYLGYESTDSNREPELIKPEEYEKSDRLRSCIGCYSCLSMCPVLKKTESFVGPYFMRNLADISFDPRDDMSRNEEVIDSGLYYCTSCGQCTKTCPKEIDIYGKAIELMRAKIFNENEGPLAPHKLIRESVINTNRTVKPDENSDYPEGFIKRYHKDNEDKKAKVAFFTGCMIDYKLPWIAEYLVKLFDKLDIDVDIPEGQVCCGSPLLRTGQVDIVPDLVNTNYEIFNDYDTIITVCAGCGATLKNNYPEYGVELNVMDISEFLQDKLNPDDMNELNLRVTYHDPCHLVRSQNISQEPRNILKSLKGVEFIEMEKPAQCCGAGGGVKSGKPEIAEALADEKVDMIDKLDVDYVVTICPFCEYNIGDSLKKKNSKTSVINMMELLNKAYE
ncbi:MAG: succinate dehydrogenase/fumarate reductase iron-sulfur subunit [Methanosphaera sp.]|nr:succinate dehydrogenase/fumarate reductase iron-sulfur subunit [Methanosphaera sp.]